MTANGQLKIWHQQWIAATINFTTTIISTFSFKKKLVVSIFYSVMTCLFFNMEVGTAFAISKGEITQGFGWKARLAEALGGAGAQGLWAWGSDGEAWRRFQCRGGQEATTCERGRRVKQFPGWTETYRQYFLWIFHIFFISFASPIFVAMSSKPTKCISWATNESFAFGMLLVLKTYRERGSFLIWCSLWKSKK